MTAYAELTSATMNAISDIMVPRGYRYAKSLGAFRKPNPLGCWQLHVAAIRHPSVDFDLSAGVGIRFDAVQEFLFEGSVVKDSGRGSVTVGSNLANIAGVGLMRWTVADANDVQSAAIGVVDAFDRVGLPYLLKYADPEAVMRKLMSNDADAWTLVPTIAHQRMKALALAHVLGKSNLVESIITKAEVDSAGDPDMDQFRVLADRIRRKRAAHES